MREFIYLSDRKLNSFYQSLYRNGAGWVGLRRKLMLLSGP